MPRNFRPGLAQQENLYKPPPGARVDWSHPIPRKLVGGWVFNEAGGSLVYDIGQGSPAPGTFVNGPTWVRGLHNHEIQFAAASDQSISVGNVAKIQITDAITIMTEYRLTTTPANNASFSLVAKDADSGGRAYVLDLVRRDSFPNLAGVRFYINGGSPAANLVEEGRNPAAGDRRIVVGSYSPSLITLYVDGKKVDEQVPSSASIPTATAPLRFGRRDFAGFLDPLNGNLRFVFIWNRKLTDVEVRQLSARPYRFIVPQAPRSRAVFLDFTMLERDAEVPLDFGGLETRSRDALLPLDFGGLETRQRDALLPAEFNAGLQRDPLLPLDFGGLETRSRDALLDLAFSGAIARGAQLPLELDGIGTDFLLHRWLVLIKAQLPLLHAWNVFKLAEEFPITHTWTVKEPIAPLPHRWNVTGDVLTPFGVDPDTGAPIGGTAGDVQCPVATKDKTP